MRAPNSVERKLTELDFIRLKKFAAAGTLRQCNRPVLVVRGTRRNRVLTAIGRGDPGRQTVIQQEHSGADLVVLGKTRSTIWEDFFCGSVAHYVLSWGSSDVLVVPNAYLQATAPREARGAATFAGNKPALQLRPAGRRT